MSASRWHRIELRWVQALLVLVLLELLLLHGGHLAAQLLGNLGRGLLTPMLVAETRSLPAMLPWQARTAAATPLLAWAVALEPGEPRHHRSLTLAYFEAGELTAAAQAFVEAQQIQPDTLLLKPGDHRYHLLRAKGLEINGDYVGAVAQYRLGLAMGAGRVLPAYYREYYTTLAEAYQQEGMRDFQGVQAQYLAARWYWKAGAIAQAEALLWSLVDDSRLNNLQRAQVHLHLGRAAERRGELEAAAKHYRQAAVLAPALATAWLHIARLASVVGQDAVQAAEQQLAEQQPQYRVDLLVTPGWVLEGFNIDQETLEAGPLVDLMLYWRPKNPAQDGPAGWTRIGERWIQTGEFLNLAPNAGFEWAGTDDQKIVFGYPGHIFQEEYQAESSGVYQVIQMQRTSTTTHVIGLVHSGVYRRTSLVSYPFPVEPDAVYLQVGWRFHGHGSRSSIGRHWIGKDVREEYPYNWTTCPGPEDQWWLCVGLAMPMSGAERAEIWLLNSEATGDAYFDDLLFVELDVPRN